jgi:hypothetical protein
MNKFSQEDLKNRAVRRIAKVLYEHWEEGRDVHSRVFETLMPYAWILAGRSKNGGGWREHVVPCAYLGRQCIQMYESGHSVEIVEQMIHKYLRIVEITREERKHLDFVLGLKERMPSNWEFGTGDPFERLKLASIEF